MPAPISFASRPQPPHRNAQIHKRGGCAERPAPTAQQWAGIDYVDVRVHYTQLREAHLLQHAVGGAVTKSQHRVELARAHKRSEEHEEAYADDVLLPIRVNHQISRDTYLNVGIAVAEAPPISANVPNDLAGGAQSGNVRRRRTFGQSSVSPVPNSVVIL